MSTPSVLMPEERSEHTQEQYEKISNQLDNITEVLQIMNSFRESSTLCDVLLTTDDGKEISAHKVILGSASTVFLSMFMDEKEKHEFVIPIKDIDGDILEILVKYMYTFKLDLNFDDKNIEKVLKAANFFDLNNVKNICCDFIENNLNSENCLYFMKCAELFSFKRLYDLSFAYSLKHFLKIKKSTLNDLTCENIIVFISSNNLETESEEQVFDFVLEWVKFDLENRKVFIPELMKHVRWPFLPTNVLFRVLNEPLIKIHNECLFLLVEATMMHFANSKQPSSLTLNSLSTRSKRRLPLICKPDVIAYINEKNGFDLDTSDPNSKWTYLPDRIIPPNTYSRIIAFDDGNLMSICGLNSSGVVTNDVFMFDVSNYWLNWIQTAPTVFKRRDFAVCTDQKRVYVIGGINENGTLDSIEYFDRETKQWNLLDKMKDPRSRCSAVCHKSFIYIIGGRRGTDCSSSIDCYNTFTNKWVEFCHPFPHPIESASVTILNNILYVIGGINPTGLLKNICLNTVYALKNGDWVHLQSMKSSRKDAGVVVVNEKQLYIVGGHIIDYAKIKNRCYYDTNYYCDLKQLENSINESIYKYVNTTEIYNAKNNKLHSHPAMTNGNPCNSNLFLWSETLVDALIKGSENIEG